MAEEQNPCRGCIHGCCYAYEFCERCWGEGKITDFAVGLGPEGLLPAYVEIPCPECKGLGYQRYFCPMFINEN